ncbi:DUF4191 domain-containing protein [Aeromicrobium sp. YIM 150415]|uniref:DUF4191 domain-containing protein n=1 Tax=Aeromicrobium piscarium TaxID=2590901 RepID=A0A554RN81_9ACTN|nr:MULTISPECIES: DUF4191 domain-containing protein [Aeromicrobium]MBM9464385.1 DUF4191 domain-containing protein [Aeromicrobium sp. YIM 150415]TSD55549.1 DUF4191 domain-containing protein [Aeromicrobium piscarium]
MSNPAAVPQGRIAQMRQAYRNTKQTDPRLGWILLAIWVVAAAITATLSTLLVGTGWFSIILTVFLSIAVASLATITVFGRRAEKSMYQQAEGQLGAGGAALTMLRRGWTVKQAVGFNKQQDVVHRVIGRPGVILVGEGSPGRTKNLLTSEAKKHARIVGEDVPITMLMVGRGEGEVPLPKLVKKVRKLPKKIKAAQQTEVLYKVKALDSMRPAAPMPRGPMPTSMKGARKMMRG